MGSARCVQGIGERLLQGVEDGQLDTNQMIERTVFRKTLENSREYTT